MPNRSDGPPALIARDVSKRFLVRHNTVVALKDRILGVFDARKRERVEEFWALRHVSFSVAPGEAIGLVGRNGSGKSTLLKLVAGLMPASGGALFMKTGTRVGTMIELGVGFHPELTAIENVHLSASIQGCSREQVDELLPKIVEYSGLGNFMDQPLRNFSSGMYMRLGFAVAANLSPDLLLLDEVFAVGDADFQKRCIATMQGFRERGCTVLFVSHAAAAVREVCTRVIVLDAGHLRFDGDVDEGIGYYAKLRSGGDITVRPEPPDPQRASLAPSLAHRGAMGTTWEALGPWASDFLVQQGLSRDEFFLDLGCGSLPVALHVLPLLAPTRYWGIDADQELYDAGVQHELAPAGVVAERGHFLINDGFDLSRFPAGFTFALAHSLAHRVSPEHFERVLEAALGRLAPGGRLFVAVPAAFAAHLGAVTRLAGRLGVPVETLEDAAHPNGERVLRLTRRVAA